MRFSHIDVNGKANMVDVTDKITQVRTAIAEGEIKLQKNTIQLINDNKIAKGNVLTVAQIAGIQSAKNTAYLIPLCHNLNLSKVDVKFEVINNKIKVISTVRSIGVTGVEMEALTAVSVALLTIYDMCKAVDKQMVLGNIKLISKTKL